MIGKTYEERKSENKNMKNKGFTLVELLAVIAILAILVIIALPNVLSMFRDAKENTFVEEVQKLYQTAETAYINSAMGTSTVNCFSSNGTDKLDLTGRELKYVVLFNADGVITKVVADDGSYLMNAGTGKAELKITDIVSTKSQSEGKYAPTTSASDTFDTTYTCALLQAAAAE